MESLGREHPSSAQNNVNKGHALVLNYDCQILIVDYALAPPKVPPHDSLSNKSPARRSVLEGQEHLAP